MKRTANMMIRKLFSSVRFDMLWKDSWQLQPRGQEWKAPGSISEVLVDHRHGHLLMYFTFAVLCATTGNLRSYNRHRTANKAGSLLTPALRRQKTTGHSDARTIQASQGRQAGDGREEGCTEGMVRGRGGRGRCAERAMGQHRKVMASQAIWEGGQASGGRTSDPWKSSPETYRPECKSWCASNSSWKLCSALYARMVQSPRREDAKWENTGLRAGEAETDTRQRKSGRLEPRKPLPPELCGHTPGKGHTRGFLEDCLREEGWCPFREDPPHDPRIPAHTNLHFNYLEMKDSLWTLFFFNQIQITARFR